LVLSDKRLLRSNTGASLPGLVARAGLGIPGQSPSLPAPPSASMRRDRHFDYVKLPEPRASSSRSRAMPHQPAISKTSQWQEVPKFRNNYGGWSWSGRYRPAAW
jgi:hypothetical protein